MNSIDLKSLIHKMLGVGFVKLLQIPITIIVSVILARYLGAEGYGMYTFIFSVITLLTIPVGNALSQYLTREVAHPLTSNRANLISDILSWADRWVIQFSFIIITCIFLLTTYNKFVDETVLWWIASSLIPINGLAFVRLGILRGSGFVVQAQIPELLIRSVVQILLLVFLIEIFELNLKTAILVLIFAAISVVLSYKYLFAKNEIHHRSNLRLFSKKDFSRVKSMSPFILIAVVSSLNTEISIIILGFLSSDFEVAIMKIAQTGSLVVAFSLTMINAVIAPHIVVAKQTNDRAQLRRLSVYSARIAFLLAVVPAVALYFYGDYILYLLYGKVFFIDAFIPLKILCAAQLFSVLFGSVGPLLNMCGYERDTLHGGMLGLLLNVIFTVMMVPVYGSIGAAIGGALGLATWNIFLAIRVVQRLRIRPTAL